MHTLMVAERFWPAIGGVEGHLANLLPRLAGRGHRFVVVAPAHTPGLPAVETFAPGVTVHRLPFRRRRRRAYWAAWSWWLANRDIVRAATRIHFHGTYALLQWFGPAHALAAGRQRFMTFHGYEMRFPVPRRARMYRRVAAWFVPRYLCAGHFLTKWFDLKPAGITYGGVTVPAAPPPRPKTPQAVFIGRLDADTGLDIYLQALRQLRAEHGRELPLLVCGDGPWRERLTRQANGLPVRFLGFVDRPEEQLADSDIAFVSGYLAILEALAWQRPIFSVYHTPVKRDYLHLMPGSTKMLRIAGTPGELVAQLAAHLADPAEASGRIAKGAEFAAAQTWDALADLYEVLWLSP